MGPQRLRVARSMAVRAATPRCRAPAGEHQDVVIRVGVNPPTRHGSRIWPSGRPAFRAYLLCIHIRIALGGAVMRIWMQSKSPGADPAGPGSAPSIMAVGDGASTWLRGRYAGGSNTGGRPPCRPVPFAVGRSGHLTRLGGQLGSAEPAERVRQRHRAGEQVALAVRAADAGAAGRAPRWSRCPRRPPSRSSVWASRTMPSTSARCWVDVAIVVDERLVDLQHVDRHVAQVAQRRVAGAEVVDRDPDAESGAARRGRPRPGRRRAAAGSR